MFTQVFLQVQHATCTSKVGIVDWRRKRDGFVRTGEEVAEVMGLGQVKFSMVVVKLVQLG